MSMIEFKGTVEVLFLGRCPIHNNCNNYLAFNVQFKKYFT